MSINDKTTLERALDLITKKIFPTLVSLMKDLGLDEVSVKVKNLPELTVTKKGEFKYKEYTFDYDSVVNRAEGFNGDTLSQLRVQIVEFTKKISELRETKKEILNLIKYTDRKIDTFREYQALILEKID